MSRDRELKYSLAAIIEGLQLVAKYCEHGEETQFAIEGQHDIIYARSDQTKEEWSEKDVKRMEELGWFWSNDAESWARHA